MLNAADFAGVDTGGDLIPKGQLAFATITKVEPRVSQSGRRYAALTLVINPGQPFERRNLWHNFMDPTDAEHKAVTKQIAMSDLAKVLEVGKGANPETNPDGYKIDNLTDLMGLTVAIRVGIEKGTGGYDDKNRVEFISPNPKGSTAKHFKNLKDGVFNPDGPPSHFAGQKTGDFSADIPTGDPAPAAGGGGADWLS